MIVIIKDKLPTLSTDIFDASAEIWTQQPPKMGDHIRVKRGLYAHHGIFVSDKEVIHFTGKDGDSILDWSKPEVIQSDLDYFLKFNRAIFTQRRKTLMNNVLKVYPYQKEKD